MRLRLSGWQRIGILLFVIWSIFYGKVLWDTREAEIEKSLNIELRICAFERDLEKKKQCNVEAFDYSNAERSSIGLYEVKLLGRLIGTVFVGWIACWALLEIGRWIGRG